MKRIVGWCMMLACASTLCAKEIKDSKILLCGIARNVEGAVPATIRSMQTIGEHFADYRVIIYENNSTDQTAAKFKKWASQNDKVTFLSETWDEEDYYEVGETGKRKLYRTEVLAYARNVVLEEALKAEYDDYEYILIADLDFAKPWYIDGILSSFDYEGEWDAITANGILANWRYADWYAFRDDDHPFGAELMGQKWWYVLGKWRRDSSLKITDPYLPVMSAFGGLAIYKRESVIGCSYSGLITPDLELLMQKVLDRTDEKAQAHIEHYKNQIKSQISFVMPWGKIHWLPDTRLYTECPTVCEHVTFHASMIKNGHGKIFVNPKMIVKYGECL